MSASPLRPAGCPTPSSGWLSFAGWIGAGAVGVAVLFTLSGNFSISDRSPGVFGVLLGIAAGCGLGRWANVMKLQSGVAVGAGAWFCIFSGEVFAAAKTNHDRVAFLRTKPIWQESQGDPLTERLRLHVAEGPPGESEEDRQRRLNDLAEFERGDAIRKQHFEQLTFSGYLASRIPKTWGRWPRPWPAVFWVAEVLSASTLGACATLIISRSGSQGAAPARPQVATEEPPAQGR